MAKTQDQGDDERWLAEIRGTESAQAPQERRPVLPPDPWLDGPVMGGAPAASDDPELPPPPNADRPAFDDPFGGSDASPEDQPLKQTSTNHLYDRLAHHRDDVDDAVADQRAGEQAAAPDPWTGAARDARWQAPQRPTEASDDAARSAPHDASQPDGPGDRRGEQGQQREWQPHQTPAPAQMPTYAPPGSSAPMPEVQQRSEPMPIPRLDDPWAPKDSRPASTADQSGPDGATPTSYEIPRLPRDAAPAPVTPAAPAPPEPRDPQLTSHEQPATAQPTHEQRPAPADSPREKPQAWGAPMTDAHPRAGFGDGSQPQPFDHQSAQYGRPPYGDQSPASGQHPAVQQPSGQHPAAQQPSSQQPSGQQSSAPQPAPQAAGQQPWSGAQRAPYADQSSAPTQQPQQAGFQAPSAPQSGAFAVPPQAGGGVPSQFGGSHTQPPSVMPLDLSDAALVKQRKDAPEAGWRRAVYKASFGGINPGISREQVEKNALIDRIRTPIRGCHKIAVVSLKGGIGKTTTTSCLGLTLAHYRGDRVVALDANPDAGTLAERLTGVTDVSVRNMLDNIDSIDSFTDISRYMSLASRLQVLASDQDAEVSEAFDADQYMKITGLLSRYYNVILTDSGTGMLHSAMRGTLEEANSLVVVGAPSVDGSSRAAKTLDWLVAHGYGNLVENAVAVISSVREKSDAVDMDVLRNHFGARCRSVIEIPYDPHLVIGGRIDMSQIRPQTERAYLELAATVADGFRPNR